MRSCRILPRLTQSFQVHKIELHKIEYNSHKVELFWIGCVILTHAKKPFPGMIFFSFLQSVWPIKKLRNTKHLRFNKIRQKSKQNWFFRMCENNTYAVLAQKSLQHGLDRGYKGLCLNSKPDLPTSFNRTGKTISFDRPCF